MHPKIPRLASVITVAIISSFTAFSASAQECEVKIGIAGPMAGGAAAWGLASKAGAEFAAAMANDAGGLQMGERRCKVSVTSFDAQYTSAGGAAAADYFATHSIHAVVGPVASPELAGFKPVAKRHGQINFSPAYAKDVIGPDFPLAFHQLQSPNVWGPILIKEAKNRFKFNSVVIVGANDAGGTDGSKALASMYTGQGVKAQEEYFQRGTTNFAPLVMRIMNANPAVVEVATVPPGNTITLVRQLLEAGYTGIIGSLGGNGSGPILQGANGPENLKGFYWLELMPLEDPGLVRLREDFHRVMNRAPPENPMFYTAAISAEVLLRAISTARTDQDVEKIATVLRQTTPESNYLGKGGWRGKTQYGINQELAFPVGLGIIKDGKRIGVQRIEIPSE